MTSDAGRPSAGTEGRSIITGSDDSNHCTRGSAAVEDTLPGFRPLPASPHTPTPRPPMRRPAALVDPDTSWSAGLEDTAGKRAHRSRLRSDILRLHQVATDGLTDDELAGYLPDDDRGTIAKRRGDLVRSGVLENSGRTRPTRRGCAAIVWILAK